MNPEWLAFCIPLVIAGVLVLRSRSLPKLKWLTVGLLFGTAALAGSLWTTHAIRVASSNEQLTRQNPLQGRPGGYVSSDRCQACHPGEYESWHETFHRTMTQVARPESVLGNFENVTLALNGKSYLLQRRGQEFWVEMEDPAASRNMNPLANLNTPAPRIWKRVGLLTGSHHMQAYWLPGDNGNMQVVFPFAWLKEERRWVPFQQTFLRDPTLPPADHVWNLNCIQCHATGGQPQVDAKTHLISTRAGELGIACEACHGPGEAHISANQNPLRRYAWHWRKQPDPTIINPKRLSPRLSSEVCGQCHGIKWIANSAEWRTEGFTFRPGQELDNSTPLVRPAHLDLQPWLKEPLRRNPAYLDEHYWPDGMVRVSGRDFNGLVEAPCHQRGNLACVSCHSLHQSNPTNQLAAGMESNQACLQCHQKFGKDVPAHTHHAAGSGGSLCYNCHMPHTVYGLLKAIRSHQIDSPNAATTLATGRPNACNLCHLDQSLGWTAQKLSEWYGQKPVSMSEDQQRLSATVLNLLEGDAGQRALAAYSMGWLPARKASGERWQAPYLAMLLDDPYSAVRYVAHRSLRSLPGEYGRLPYDFVGNDTERQQSADHVLDAWRNRAVRTLDRTGSEIFIRPDGSLDETEISRHRQRRNNRSMDLQE